MVVAQEFLRRQNYFLQVEPQVLVVLVAGEELGQVRLIAGRPPDLQIFELCVELVRGNDRYVLKLFDFLMEQREDDFAVGAIEFVSICLMILGDQYCKPVHYSNASLAQLLEAPQLVSKALISQLNRTVLILVHLQRGKQCFKFDNLILTRA